MMKKFAEAKFAIYFAEYSMLLSPPNFFLKSVSSFLVVYGPCFRKHLYFPFQFCDLREDMTRQPAVYEDICKHLRGIIGTAAHSFDKEAFDIIV